MIPPKKKAGRPRGITLDTSIRVKCTKREKSQWHGWARKLKMSLSEYVRRMLNE